MNEPIMAGIALFVLVVVLFLGLPVWLCMLLVGSIGYALIYGGSILDLLGLVFPATVGSYTFAILPVFLLMGEIADISGMMTEAFNSLNTWLKRVPGGLAMASVVGAAAFSLISGSSVATTAIMTRIAMPQLLHHKYSPALAAGAFAAGGTLGNLIPPGVLIILYAIMVKCSVGELFIACYIPGFLLTAMYMVQIYTQCKIDPSMGPAAGSSTWKEKLFAIKGLWAVFAVFVVTLGGIEFGFFSPNEAASVVTVFVFVFALARRTVNGQNLLRAFKNTLASTGMALAIITGAQIFNIFVTVSGLPQALAAWITGLHLSGLGLIILIMVFYYILGTAMDGFAMLLLTLPILLPLLNANHIDLIWFGVLAITQVEISNITPPVGLNLFVVAAMSKPYGITMGTVFRGALPFCITGFIFIVLIIAFPQISTFLVTLMKH